MDWLKTALSVGTTIGKIAGMLQGANGTLVHLGPKGSGVNPEIGQAIFFVGENGKLYAANQGDVPMGIHFPAGRGEVPAANTYMIPRRERFNITEAFNVYAQAEQDQLIITPVEVMSAPGARANTHATIQAQGTNVPAGVTVKLGPYIEVTVNASDRTILVTVLGGLALLGIVLLNINGAGDTFANLANLAFPSEHDGETKSMTVPIPAGVEASRGLESIDITVAIEDLETLLERFSQEHAGLMEPLSEKDCQRIAAYTGA
ncbi:hypothetical protein AB0L53_43590 [Nonomuraea sp. NPDC052129]|uniref:hypothetical protein n=1 Tax=Nonomuraea sp. NPDC052129 TaxID=3154651 RepID=UPI0034171F91